MSDYGKCEHCHRDAVPRAGAFDLCCLHWHLWFSWPDRGQDFTEKRIIRLVRRGLRDTWKERGRPKDWRQQWREVAKVTMRSARGGWGPEGLIRGTQKPERLSVSLELASGIYEIEEES